MGSLESEFKLNIVLRDTPGFIQYHSSSKNYELDKITSGQIGHNSLIYKDAQILPEKDVELETQPHACVFLDNSFQNSFIDQVVALKPLIVIPKVDTFNTKQVETEIYERAQDVIKHVQGIYDNTTVFPCVNYTSKYTNRHPALEYNALLILQAAIRSAKDFVMRN